MISLSNVTTGMLAMMDTSYSFIFMSPSTIRLNVCVGMVCGGGGVGGDIKIEGAFGKKKGLRENGWRRRKRRRGGQG